MTSDEKALQKLIERWTIGPNALYYFVTEALAFKPYPHQKDFFLRLGRIVWAKYKKRVLKEKLTKAEAEDDRKIGVSIRAGRGPGKEAATACAQIWFQSMFEPHEVMVTGPSVDHIRDVYWKEVYKWLFRKDKATGQNYYFFSQDFAWTATKIYRKAKKGEADAAINFASYKTVQKAADDDTQAEGVSGRHQDFIMYLGDEASSMMYPVYNALKSSATREEEVAVFILIGNPNRLTGPFYDIYHTDEGRRWEKMHWNSEECEGIDPDVIEDARQYGEDSNYYRVNIRGEFPLIDEDKVIPWQSIEEASRREMPYEEYDVVALIDPSGEGKDKTTILIKQGPQLVDMYVVNEVDMTKAASDCVSRIEEWDAKRVYIDKIGVGYGLFCELKNIYKGRRRVYGVNTKESPSNKRRYLTLRDELWMKLREQFMDGLIALPEPNRKTRPMLDRLKVELNTPDYETDSQGRLRVMAKAKMKKLLGGRSPDYADSLVLSAYHDYHQYDSEMIKQRKKYKNPWDEEDSAEGGHYGWLEA